MFSIDKHETTCKKSKWCLRFVVCALLYSGMGNVISNRWIFNICQEKNLHPTFPLKSAALDLLALN